MDERRTERAEYLRSIATIPKSSDTPKHSAPDWLKQDNVTRPHESEFAKQKPSDREYQRQESSSGHESWQTSHYQRHAGELEVSHQFELGSAFRLGLGIGIGLILAIPIGVFITIIILLMFGSTLAEMGRGF